MSPESESPERQILPDKVRNGGTDFAPHQLSLPFSIVIIISDALPDDSGDIISRHARKTLLVRDSRGRTLSPRQNDDNRDRIRNGEAVPKNMPDILHLLLDRIPTPIGSILIAVDHEGNLRTALFTEDDEVIRRQLRLHYGRAGFTLKTATNPGGLSSVICRYFAGDLHAIDAIPVETGGTSFQREVWHALREIRCGATTSYGELARRIGHPSAVRAVGSANGANPIVVVVPCHRVIGSDGSLTGYGGGIERKRWLLNHEKSPTLF
jgi:methylated-DNA-[protein]-cysteine S-methyltransferase